MSKRIHARAMVHRRVEYRHAQGQGEGVLLDLSLLGCRIKGASPFHCGTRLRLQLWLPDQALPVNVELAAVQWIAAEQFGVRFLEVSPTARGRIEQVVQVLSEAQQPDVTVISIPAFFASEQGAAGHGLHVGFGKPTDD
jgi:PilZ domain